MVAAFGWGAGLRHYCLHTMIAVSQSRSRLRWLLAVLAAFAFSPAAATAASPAIEGYQLELPGVPGSTRVAEVGDVAGGQGTIGGGGGDESRAIGQYLLSGSALLAIAPLLGFSAAAIATRRSRPRL